MAEFEYSSDLEKEVFEYLDELRKSGIVNMVGAGKYVQEDFDLTKRDAQTFLVRWIETFSERHL